MKRLAALTLAAALFIPVLGRAQQNFPAEVQGLAPQLVTFAGSTANFQSLVNGLALGAPVTLVALTPDGLQQTATFTPAGTLTSLQIAQALEQTRQALISRGIATPTPQQIGIALLGGTLPTPAGAAAMTAILPANTAATTGSASTGTSATLTPTGAASLQVTTRAAPQPTLGATGAVLPGVTTAPTTGFTPAGTAGNASDTTAVRNTSDTPTISHTSDTPVLPTPGNTNQPSPAAQIQQRR